MDRLTKNLTGKRIPVKFYQGASGVFGHGEVPVIPRGQHAVLPEAGRTYVVTITEEIRTDRVDGWHTLHVRFCRVEEDVTESVGDRAEEIASGFFDSLKRIPPPTPLK